MDVFSRRGFVAGVGLIGLSVVAQGKRCEVCDGRVQGDTWFYTGVNCCSQTCVDQLRPTCSVCGSILREEYISAKRKNYCGEACFETTLIPCEICGEPIRKGFTITRHNYCAACVENRPTCFSCGLPAAYPTQLKDGREICNHCMRGSVKDQGMAQKHYERALRNLQAWTGLKLSSVPKLELVDRDKMKKLSKKLRKSNSPVSIRGLYSRQITVTTRRLSWGRKEETKEERETIYVVDHLNDEVFRVAAMHELMHDLIHEHFQRLEDAPLWVHEGICQQAAAEYCRRRNYTDVLHGIENCEDPDYGDGYRYINKLTGFNGWPALKRWMETVDVATLSEIAPK